MMAAIARDDRDATRPTSAGTSTACTATRATRPTPSPTRACEAARELELDALVVPTLSGRSARLVSAHRPTVPIYALSPGSETVRRCGLMWGVRGRVDAPPRGHRGADRRRRAARRRARLVPARPARRHHRRPAERRAGDDVAVPGPGPSSMAPERSATALARSSTRRSAPCDEHDDRDDRLRRAEVVERCRRARCRRTRAARSRSPSPRRRPRARPASGPPRS